jgi:hypothetical protein
MGRFDGRGSDLIKKIDDIKRDHKGRFEKGTHGGPRAGAGRPLGSKNKTTLALKEAILGALEAKVLPTTLAADNSNGGLGVQLVFRREIVWPDGRCEVEGVTPKALPAPDASRPTDPTDDTNERAVR